MYANVCFRTKDVWISIYYMRRQRYTLKMWIRWNWKIGQGICLEFVLSIRILLRHFFHHSILFFRFISDQSKVRIFLTFLYSLFHSLFYNTNTLQFFFLTISQNCWWNSIEKGYGHMKMVTICFSSRVSRRSKNHSENKKKLWIVYFFFFSVLIIFFSGVDFIKFMQCGILSVNSF